MIALESQPEAMSLRVENAAAIAEDIHMFELRHPDGTELPPFTAGAHLSLRVPNGEERKYSLCNDPGERDRYVIAVKREREGRGGSISLIDGTKAGDLIPVFPPRNDFGLTGNPVRYLFIAGGIGITPIRSMILHLMNTGGRPFKLYYFSRTPDMMAFRDEFTAPEFRGKVVLHHDNGDPEKAFDLWPVLEEPKGAHIYCCGPRPLMEAVRDMTGHWSSSAVHFEDFGAGRTVPGAEDRPFSVRLAKSGDLLDVPVGKSILEVLHENGHAVPSSCESGTCGTCRTRLVDGEPDHRDLVLSEHERAREIMVCVSRARSPELVLDL
jgi:phthalate 4,5-dioxygenase reductase subunit